MPATVPTIIVSDALHPRALVVDEILALNAPQTAANVLAAAGTIATANVTYTRQAPAGAVAGIILAAGTYHGQTIVVQNNSAAASTITFAAAGTSNVADGVAAVITGPSQKMFVWDAVSSLWYHN